MTGSLSLAISHAIAYITPLHEWTGFWLRGSFVVAYQVFFVLLFLPCAVWIARRYLKRPRSFLAMAAWGTGLGYLSGLAALLLHPLAQANGWDLFLKSLRLPTLEAVAALLWFPVRLLSYLIGAMTGIAIALLLHFSNQRLNGGRA
ncbi:hypothetical protein W02_35090 [Nitrospira sp. KM1]|nr:hypothetical protein W02_35090 [Nitrospira sp. KM1]